MKKNLNGRFILLTIFIFIFLAACGDGGEVSFSTANIASATLAKDEAGTQATTIFAPDDTFYLLVALANAPDDTKVKADWTAVSVEGADPNTVLDNVELTTGSGDLTFDMANDAPWPAGEYKVDLFLNGELDQTLTFNVQAPLGAESPETEAAAAPTVEEPVAETNSGAANSIDEVKTAVIQIEAQGTFRDPEVGTQYNTAGRGSGFIIDPSGLAVTNNHVVTGAALLKVWIGGESEPRNARILGVSECSDLAVIDIDGEGYPYLEWHEGPIDVGLDVYAAGFPLGDPEYTLTRGIISKASANGETDWASVDGVVQHDATINPGNSGGALITADGKLVGVNYAGASGVDQYFAIARDEALRVIDELKQGNDYLSTGINGRAIADPDSGLYGIWVSSVKSGTPAEKAGIQPGDIVTQLEGLVLATDGTMADYCDILRTHHPEDTLAIETVRYDTQEVLAGQLNGDPLVTSFSFAQELQEEVTDTEGSSSATYDEYVTVTDDSTLLQVNIPASWSQVDGSPWQIDGEVIGASLTAAPNLDNFYNTWGTPGMIFNASADLAAEVNPAGALDLIDYSDSCTYDNRYTYEDALYTGYYDLWENCGGEGTLGVSLAAAPAGGEFIILVLVQVVSDADLDALDQILNSFQVIVE